jgi:hypothetical protein
LQALSDVFGDRIINTGIWPARSADFIFSDFFCPRLFKWQTLQQQPKNRRTKKNIRREFANIPSELLQGVSQKLFCQCGETLCAEGQHLQHL